MKPNIFKSIIVLAISAIFGLICYSIANEACSRNIISLVVTTATVTIGLGAAIAFDFNCGNRKVNIKTAAWIFAFIILVTNIVFSCFAYNPIMYAAVVSLIALIDMAIVYSIYKS